MEALRLSSLKGSQVVSYFYRKDDTPWCTLEGCSFRDSMPKFGGLDAVVLGVNKDSIQSHAKFIDKYSLSFTLLSDEELKAHGLYLSEILQGRRNPKVRRPDTYSDPLQNTQDE